MDNPASPRSPSLADLVRYYLTVILGSLALPECAELLRAGLLPWSAAAELLRAFGPPSDADPAPALVAAMDAADAMHRGDAAAAVAVLAACERLAPSDWCARTALSREAPVCERCGEPATTLPGAAGEALALADGAVRSGEHWCCSGCLTAYPALRAEYAPPARTTDAAPPAEPQVTAARRPARSPRAATAPASPATAVLTAASAEVPSADAAVAWWASHAGELLALSDRERDGVRRALVARVAVVGGRHLASRAAAETWLRPRLKAALTAARHDVAQRSATSHDVVADAPATPTATPALALALPPDVDVLVRYELSFHVAQLFPGGRALAQEVEAAETPAAWAAVEGAARASLRGVAQGDEAPLFAATLSALAAMAAGDRGAAVGHCAALAKVHPETWLSSTPGMIAMDAEAAAAATAETLPTETPAPLALVPALAETHAQPLTPEQVIAAFAAAVETVALPSEAVTVWLAHRAAIATLPAFDREAAWLALCTHVENTCFMAKAHHWLRRSIKEQDGWDASTDVAEALAPLAGAA